jgi:hypothetical protein
MYLITQITHPSTKVLLISISSIIFGIYILPKILSKFELGIFPIFIIFNLLFFGLGLLLESINPNTGIIESYIAGLLTLNTFGIIIFISTRKIK